MVQIMPSSYYKPCQELDRCVALDHFWQEKEYKKWFAGYLAIAKDSSYPLAECQVGYAYLEGIGVAKDLAKGFYWTQRSAEHGDRDAQYNLACMYEEELGVTKDNEKIAYWLKKAALQGNDLAIEKCQKDNICLTE